MGNHRSTDGRRLRRVAIVFAAAALVVSLAGCDSPITPKPPPPPPPPPAGLAVSSVVPNTAISGASLTISGSGFRAGVAVTFGGVTAEVGSVSSSSIVVRTPEFAPGPVDIVVTNTNGESATLHGAFTLIPFAVTETGPRTGYGGTLFGIRGTGLIAGTTVTFGGVSPTVAFFEPRIGGVIGLLPPHAPGPVDITVTHPLGRSLTIPSALTYVPPPVLTASPVTVPVGGSLTVSWVAEVTSSIDYISLYPEGAANDAHWLEIAAQRVTGKSGSMTFTAPSSPGRYEFRYLPFEGQWGAMAARSNVVTVTSASPAHAHDIVAILRCSNGATRSPCPMTPLAGIKQFDGGVHVAVITPVSGRLPRVVQ